MHPTQQWREHPHPKLMGCAVDCGTCQHPCLWHVLLVALVTMHPEGHVGQVQSELNVVHVEHAMAGLL